jgi:hypothetical protein
MEYKNTHQGRFSNDYMLVIGQDATGVWKILLNGPRPFRGSLEATDLAGAEDEAYSVADRYRLEKGIADLPTARDKMRWVAYP